MTTKTNCTAAGASPVMPAAGQDLKQTVASDLPYTENGLLDLGALCRNASRFSENRRINRVRQAIYGSHSIVDVLHAGDDSLCSMSANVRGGLLSALTVLLDTLDTDAEALDRDMAARHSKGGAA